MTRKDYQLIAEAIKISMRYEASNIENEAGIDAVKNVAYDLVKALASDNPRFDKERFLIAAGIYEKCDFCDARATVFATKFNWCGNHKGRGLVKDWSPIWALTN